MSDTPRTDAARKEASRMGGTLMETVREKHYLKLCEELEREMSQAKLPVIGECEDCGHKIVTPLRRL